MHHVDVRHANSTAPSRVQVFLHTLAEDRASNALYDSMHYRLLGRVPEHYKIDGVARDAHVWATPLNGSVLVEYAAPVGGGLVDLSSPTLAAVPRKSARQSWARTLFVQFALPALVVLVMFGISYGLVVAGPLRGVGRLVLGRGGGPTTGAGALADDDEEL